MCQMGDHAPWSDGAKKRIKCVADYYYPDIYRKDEEQKHLAMRKIVGVNCQDTSTAPDAPITGIRLSSLLKRFRMLNIAEPAPQIR